MKKQSNTAWSKRMEAFNDSLKLLDRAKKRSLAAEAHDNRISELTDQILQEFGYFPELEDLPARIRQELDCLYERKTVCDDRVAEGLRRKAVTMNRKASKEWMSTKMSTKSVKTKGKA